MLCISTIYLNWCNTGKNTRQPSKWDHDYAMVICPILVPFDAENAARLPTSATKQHKITDLQSNQQAIYPLLLKMRLLTVGLLGKQSETEN